MGGSKNSQTVNDYTVPPFSEAIYDAIRANTRLTIYESDGTAADYVCGCALCAQPFSDTNSLRSESGVVIDDHEAKQVETSQQNVTYLDENIGERHGFAANRNALLSPDAVTNAYLSDFLSRPVNIATYTWNESDVAGGFDVTFNPWHLYFNDTNIKYKLNNFAFIKCNLRLKIMINASPFYYGALLMHYRPMSGIHGDNVISVYPSPTETDIFMRLMPYSQRPHLWIYPQNSEGGEMVLPFFYYKEWLSVGLASDFTNMGQIKIVNVTTLQSATGAVGEGVNIQVFAWAENVTLSGPTTALSMQAGVVADEYGQGVISKPASAVAGIASRLRDRKSVV